MDCIGEVVKGLQPREKGKVILFQKRLPGFSEISQMLGAMRKAGFSCDDVKDLGLSIKRGRSVLSLRCSPGGSSPLNSGPPTPQGGVGWTAALERVRGS